MTSSFYAQKHSELSAWKLAVTSLMPFLFLNLYISDFILWKHNFSRK